MDLVSSKNIQGRVRAYQVYEDRGKEKWEQCSEFKSNLVLNQWATVAAKLMTTGDARYRIAGLYLEFENTDNPGDTVTIPTFDRTRDVSYYTNLSGSSKRDYQRVPITAAQVSTQGDGFTDNSMVFFARSSGTGGIHGKTFSDSVNSTVFGASLVALVDNADATQDLIVSSFYFAEADQQQKLPTSQIGLEWELTLQ